MDKQYEKEKNEYLYKEDRLCIENAGKTNSRFVILTIGHFFDKEKNYEYLKVYNRTSGVEVSREEEFDYLHVVRERVNSSTTNVLEILTFGANNDTLNLKGIDNVMVAVSKRDRMALRNLNEYLCERHKNIVSVKDKLSEYIHSVPSKTFEILIEKINQRCYGVEKPTQSKINKINPDEFDGE